MGMNGDGIEPIVVPANDAGTTGRRSWANPIFPGATAFGAQLDYGTQPDLPAIELMGSNQIGCLAR